MSVEALFVGVAFLALLAFALATVIHDVFWGR